MPRSNEEIDQTFKINAISRRSGKVYTHENSVLFLASDPAFLAVLSTYEARCVELGAGVGKIKEINQLIARVREYQAAHPHEVGLPTESELK